eukprot:gnl/Chilomastix_cuspidata/1406.p1 GENE.gnl/Chilomastix_cuspidata/1406~~gnl/Chilomastix_cuspidata/1406.p1  ORF type:complete len:836 (+),score=304.70 gnl/Chilomastix_cuspidata/1406:47-2554(+)
MGPEPQLALLAFLALLACAFAFVEQDSCQFRAFEIEDLQVVKNCYNQIYEDLPYVQDQTIASVLSYLDANVFTEYYNEMNDTMNFSPVDIASDVRALGARDFENEYEFHHALARTLQQLKDPHSVYVMPSAFSQIFFALPFSVSSVFGADGQRLHLSRLPPDYSFVTLQFLTGSSRAQKAALFDAAQSNAPITQLLIVDEHNRSLTDGVTEPVEALRVWADREVYHSKSSAARFNRAVASDFFIRTPQYGIPSDRVFVEVNGELLEVPWLAVATADIGSQADLMARSPLSAAALGLELDESCTKPAKRRRNMPGPSRRMLSETLNLPNAQHSENMPPPLPVSAPVLGPQSIRSTTAHGALTRLFVGDSILLHEFEDAVTDTTAHLLTIPSFSPDSDEQFLADLRSVLVMLAEDTPRDMLFIDLRGNGGGSIELGVKLLYYLLPDVAKPSSGLYMRKHCPLNDLLNDEGFFQNADYISEFLSHSPIDYARAYSGRDAAFRTERVFGAGTARETMRTYMTNYTLCGPDYFDSSGHRRPDMGDTFYENIPYDQNSIYVITDGFCGSTCATFAAHMSEVHAGKFIGLGGVFDASASPDGPTGRLPVYSFAGGSVQDSKNFEEIWADLCVDLSDSRVPPPMPRDGYLRFAYEALLSWHDNHTPLEFVNKEVDFQIPWWSRARNDEGTVELAEMLATVVGFLQAQPTTQTKDTFLTTGCAQDIDAAIGGTYWDPMAGQWSDECSAVFCADGYYPVWAPGGRISDCLPLPETFVPLDAWEVISIVAFCLLGVAVVSVLTWWILHLRRRMKRSQSASRSREMSLDTYQVPSMTHNSELYSLSV